MPLNYPIKFNTIVKEKLWGRELWTLSGLKGEESVIQNGPLAGRKLCDLEIGKKFPILIKIIEANDKLSIQVHPDDFLARQRGYDCGKNEMWYILSAEPHSKIINGFTREIDAQTYQKYLDGAQLEQVLHVDYPQRGDTYFIPAGRVHAIGAGLVLAEVQQTSDITYRLYDYNRVDKDGRLRELHTDQALQAIDFSMIQDGRVRYHLEDGEATLVSCKYFTTRVMNVVGEKQHIINGTVAYVCINGNVTVNGVDLFMYESLLIPKGGAVLFQSNNKSELLEIIL